MLFFKPIALIVGMFLALLWWVQPSHAEPGFQIMVTLQCNTTEMVLDMLHEKYQELPIGAGLSKGEQVRLFTSHGVSDKETWTIVISNPNGLSCIMKGGDNWIVAPLITKGNPT